MKDGLIIILIIILVIIGNTIAQNTLKNDSEKIIEKLETLKKELNTEQALSLAEEINDLWEETEKRWSIIIFHQELDSIKTSIIAVKSSLESGDISYSYQQIENSIFLVGHVKEKWSLKWKNIF